jgi:hypothetical protein
MVPEKDSPGLTATTLQVLWAVLRDRARRDAPAELRELAGNPVLAPQAVLSPHTPNEGPQLGVDRRPADSTARAATPPQSPSRSVPPENRRRSHDDHRLEQRARSGRQRSDQPSVWWAKSRTRRRASEHGELMAKQEVLGCDESVRRQKSCEGSGHVAKEVDHRAIFRPVVQQVQPSRRLAQRRTRRVSAAHRGLCAVPIGALLCLPYRGLGHLHVLSSKSSHLGSRVKTKVARTVRAVALSSVTGVKRRAPAIAARCSQDRGARS